MELPESNVPADIFWDLIYVAGKPQVLKYGIDFKVFNHLSMPISAEEVARRIGTKPEPTSRLLDMLVIIGVITKDGDRYVNTPLAEEYLVEGKPTYMGDFYAMAIEMYVEGMDCTLYETDVSDAMLRAGFRSVESRYVEYASGTNRLDIARKA
jgi:hypothetical protein